GHLLEPKHIRLGMSGQTVDPHARPDESHRFAQTPTSLIGGHDFFSTSLFGWTPFFTALSLAVPRFSWRIEARQQSAHRFVDASRPDLDGRFYWSLRRIVVV